MHSKSEILARKAMILGLFGAYPSMQSARPETLDAYMVATDDFLSEALARACTRFIRGEVPDHSNAFMPTGPELAAQCRVFDGVLRSIEASKEAPRYKLVPYPIGGEPPPPAVALGPTKVDFGSGMIDMTDMSPAEKEAVLRDKGVPSIGAAAVLPKLKRMGDG